MTTVSNHSPDRELADFLGGRLSAFLRELPEGVLVLDRGGALVGVNARARNLLGEGNYATGNRWREALPDSLSASIRRFIKAALDAHGAHGPVVLSTGGESGRPNRVVELRSVVLPASGGQSEAVVFFLRETEESKALNASRLLLRGQSVKRRVADELRWERAMFEQLMHTVPDKIFFKDLKGRFMRIGRAHVGQFGLKNPHDAVGKTDFDFFAESYALETQAEEEEIIRTGRPLIGKEHKLVLSDGTSFWVSATKVPLRDPDGNIVGTIGVSRDITERKEAEEKLRHNHEEMQADLRMACEVQQSLLTLQYPDFRGESGLRFNHRYLPVSTLAGDFFEIIRVSPTEAGVLICDVVGHGVRAALITAFLRGLAGEIMPLARDPGAFLDGFNRGLLPVLRQADSPMFVTAFFGVVDTVSGELHYANAGHPLPFLQRSAGGVVRLGPPCDDPEPALGLIDGFQYSTARDRLNPGDRAVLFTDGLFEVEGPRGEAFGEHRVEHQLAANHGVETRELLDRLTGEARRHAQTESFTDDVCIVVVEVVNG